MGLRYSAMLQLPSAFRTYDDPDRQVERSASIFYRIPSLQNGCAKVNRKIQYM